MTNATIAARHLIDPTQNRVTILESGDFYAQVRFEDGTEGTFPVSAVDVDATPDMEAAFLEILALENEAKGEHASVVFGADEATRQRARTNLPHARHAVTVALNGLDALNLRAYQTWRQAYLAA